MNWFREYINIPRPPYFRLTIRDNKDCAVRGYEIQPKYRYLGQLFFASTLTLPLPSPRRYLNTFGQRLMQYVNAQNKLNGN